MSGETKRAAVRCIAWLDTFRVELKEFIATTPFPHLLVLAGMLIGVCWMISLGVRELRHEQRGNLKGKPNEKQPEPDRRSPSEKPAQLHTVIFQEYAIGGKTLCHAHAIKEEKERSDAACDTADDIRGVRAHLVSNENKMSDGGRGRASLGVKVWKLSEW